METIFERYLKRNELKIQQHQLKGVEWGLKNKTTGNEVVYGGGGGGETAATAPKSKSKSKIIYGGIIADEMGLGKTYQMLGIIISKIHTELPTLIVLPLALINQWRTAIRTTLGHEPLVYHGAQKKKTTLAILNAQRLVITTYGLISSAAMKKPAGGGGANLLHECTWAEIVFDEAHYLRNKSQVKAGALKLKTSCRWLITGTPIQNRQADLNSLFAILGVPEELYKKKPIKDILPLIHAFMLRRTKAEIKMDLPPLVITEIPVKWANKKETEIAIRIHETLSFSFSRNKAVFEMPILTRLVRARQVCVYPALVKVKKNTAIGGGDNDNNDNNEAEADDDADFTQYLEKHEKALAGSSKINAVIAHLVARAEDKKCKLVFCHYRGELDILAARLHRETPALVIKTLDGRTNQKERSVILNKETPCDILLLQIQTGCVGLNLQQYNQVYFVSPHWNPAVEDQAIARCYRMGQLNPTEVFRFSMVGFAEAAAAKAAAKAEAAAEEAEAEAEEEEEAEAEAEEEEEEEEEEAEEEEEEEEEEAEEEEEKNSIDQYAMLVQEKKRKVMVELEAEKLTN